MPHTNRQIPNPETRLNVITRFLHVLALLHNEEEGWNATSLAEIITLDEGDHVVSDKNIRDSINYIRKELEIDINTVKGSKLTILEEELSEKLSLQLASIYSSFIISDSTREAILKNFLNRHQRSGLWILARLYFACKEKRKISIDYTSNKGNVKKGWEVYACHMVFRTGNLYLVIQIPGEDHQRLIIINRIENLKILDGTFSGKIPDVEELFKDSLSGFITNPASVKEVTISYHESIHNRVEQFLASLEPEYKKEEDRYTAQFTSADDIYLCKQFLMYGDKLEILEPEKLRDQMVTLLRKSLSVYE